MDYRQYVLDNQEIIQAINDRTPGHEYADKLYGTLDIACSRFHSIMLKLINEPLKADQYNRLILLLYKQIYVWQQIFEMVL